MSKIAIFVSQRTDVDSVCVKNPIYQNIRCGAVFDKENRCGLQGDDTGENISHLKDYYSELTVQYWAWKNYDADYYGLCHYRRYLSFSDTIYTTKDPNQHIMENILDKESVKKFQLNNFRKMKKCIKENDVIVAESFDITSANNLKVYPHPKTVREFFVSNPRNLCYDKDVDSLLSITKNEFPQYYNCLKENLNSSIHRGYNLFVLKKDLFQLLCEYQFRVLGQVVSIIQSENSVGDRCRTVAFLSELLFNSFIDWIFLQEKYKIKELQKTFFKVTSKEMSIKSNKKKFVESGKKIINSLLPSYRVALRIENRQTQHEALIKSLKTSLEATNKKLINLENRQELYFLASNPKFSNDSEKSKMEFWESYPSATGDLLLVQKGNSILLKRLKELCDKIGVTFWLHGGTLVGALRHSGCIPWDDDIDIGMMRSDFTKLVDYLINDKNYAVEEYYYTSIYCRAHRFVRRGINSNCFVDIFTYDEVLCSEETIKERWKNMLEAKARIRVVYGEITKKRNYAPNNETLEENSVLRKELDALLDGYIMKFRVDDSNWIAWGIEGIIQGRSAPSWTHGRIFKKDDIFPYNKSSYEGVIYNIPKNHEKYIFHDYGGSFTDIPSDIGISKHYKEYFSDPQVISNIKILLESEGEEIP